VLRFSALLLPVALATLLIVAVGRRRSRWIDRRGGWLVWPLLALEVLVLGWPVLAAGVLAVGGGLYALDVRGVLPAPYSRSTVATRTR